MTELLQSPVVHGVGIVLALEGAFVLLRRLAPRIRLGWPYHAWAVGVGLVTALARSHETIGQLAWQVLALVTIALTTLVFFALVEGVVLTRPWNQVAGPLFPKLARDVLRVAILTVVTMSAAVHLFNLNLPAVLASTTLLSAAVGFALQDVLKNAFAGMALQVEKPFDIGDWLLIGDLPAQVEEITWRSTRLRTNEGVEFHEPNANLAYSRVVNYGNGRRPVALVFRIGLGYDAPPAVVRQALLAAAQSAPGVEAAPQVQVFVEKYADSAITYHVRAWTREVHALMQFQDSVNGRIWYQLQRAGLVVPFPIRTVHLRSMDRDEETLRADQTERTRSLLARLPLFQDLPAEAIDFFAAQARRQHYDDGEALVREGSDDTSLFIVEQGRVVVSKRAENGPGRIRLASMAAGEFFGEMSLLTGAPRSATVTADGPVQVLVLPREALVPLLTTDPRSAEVLSQALAARTNEQATRVQDHRKLAAAERSELSASSLLARIRGFFGIR